MMQDLTTENTESTEGKSLRVVSLFPGVGGFDLGFEQAGMKTVAVVERDAECRAKLAEKFPDAAVLDDVRVAGSLATVLKRAQFAKQIFSDDWHDRRAKSGKQNGGYVGSSLEALSWSRRSSLPACDVVCGGFPCQDLSVAGKRAGLAGKRSGLFYELSRIVDELQPSIVVWENVPGLLSSENGRDMLRVVLEFQRIGYRGCWRTLDAQYLGVAQRRRRVFGVFVSGDTPIECAVEILSLTEGMRGHSAPRRKKGKSVAGTLKGGTGQRGYPDPSDGNGGGLIEDVAGTLGGGAGDRGWSDDLDRSGAFMPETVGPVLTSTRQGDREEHGILPDVDGCLQERDTKGADSDTKGADSDTKPGHLIPVQFPEDAAHPQEIVGTLNPGAHPGAYNGQDAYTGHLMAVPILEAGARTGKSTSDARCGMGVGSDGDPMFTLQSGKQHAVAFKASHFTRGKDGAPSKVTGPLSADADKGDQDNLVLAFDTTQVSSPGNFSNPKPGDPCHPLASEAHPPAVAFDCKSSGQSGFGVGEIASTMRVENGGGHLSVAQVQWSSGGGQPENPTAQTLRSGAEHNYQFARVGMAVRRLTPVECERLQGFPDDGTAGFADSTRYRMMGNAVAVVVARWIGRRIVRVMGNKRGI